VSDEDEYERIEVQVSKQIGIDISLEALLNGLSQQAQSIASGAQSGALGAHASVVERLNRVGQLVDDLKGEFAHVRNLDAGIFTRLQSGAPPGNPSGPTNAA
jgi:hypothetical protein